MEPIEWDRSRDWVLIRYERVFASVTIEFDHDDPSIREILAVRQCLPQFRDTPPKAIREHLGTNGRFHLGQMAQDVADELVETATQNGLCMKAERFSRVSYLPCDQATRVAMLIDNDADAAALAQEMIAAGVPIRRFEDFKSTTT